MFNYTGGIPHHLGLGGHPAKHNGTRATDGTPPNADIGDHQRAYTKEGVFFNMYATGSMHAGADVGTVLYQVVMIDGRTGMDVHAIAHTRTGHKDHALTNVATLPEPYITVAMNSRMDCIDKLKSERLQLCGQFTSTRIISNSHDASRDS